MSEQVLKAELDGYKKQTLEMRFNIQQLTDRLQRIENENLKLVKQKQEIKQNSSLDVNAQCDIIQFLENERDLQQDKAMTYEIQNTRLQAEINDQAENFQKEYESKKQEYDMQKRELQEKNDNLQKELQGIKNFSKLKIELENERKNLMQSLDWEQQEKQRELADQDREKVQATDQLKKDMLHKIQETKTSLLALKKEQLQTTTRLTVLQNHQLTTELQYQSQQTEKLLFKNSKLQEQINALKRDVEIHKQVEQELAKRSHFCQKLIQKLSQRIQDLQEQLQQKTEEKQENMEFNEGEDKEKKQDELIDQLEKHIENIEKKMAKLQNDNEILQNENFYLKSRIDSTEIRYSNLATILAQNLESLRSDQQGVYDLMNENNEIKLVLDLNEIKNQPVTQWTNSEKETIFTLLLEQIKPLITKQNLLTGPNELKNYNISILDDKSQQPVMLPQINSINGENAHSDGESNDIQQQNFRRFQDVPLDISTKIVRSNLRDWGPPANSLPQSNKKNLNRRFNQNPN